MRKFTSLLSALALAALLPGTAEANVDCTSLINNPGFETKSDVLVKNHVYSPSGWNIITGGGDSYDYAATVTSPVNSGSYSFKTRDNWLANSTISFGQTIDNLPSGTYTLKAYAYPNSTSLAKGSISVLAGTTTLGTSAITSTANSWNLLSVDFTIPSGTTSITIEGIFNKIAASPEGIVYFDDFSLEYTGTETMSVLKTVLQRNLNTAPTVQGDFSSSTWNAIQQAVTAGNAEIASTTSTETTVQTAIDNLVSAIAAANSSIALKTALDKANTISATPADAALQDAISSAQQVYDLGTDNEAIKTAITILTAAIDAHNGLYPTDLTGLIKNPSFESGNTTGWNRKGSFTSSVTWSATTTPTPSDGTYGLSFVPAGPHYTGCSTWQTISLPAGTYTLSVDAQASEIVGTTTKPVLYAATEDPNWDGAPKSVLSSTEIPGYGTTFNTISTTFTISAPTNVRIGFFAPALNTVSGAYANHYLDNFKLASVNYTRTVTNGNFGTICMPYSIAADQCTGISNFYTVKGKTTAAVQLEEATTLDAGVPYVFLASADLITVVPANSTLVSAPVAGANGLTGTFTDIATVTQGQYVLKNNYLYSVDSDVKVAANRAYFDLANCADTPSGVKAISINGDATGIQSVEQSNADSNAVIYDMTGRKVTTPTHGVCIVNGKKILK